MQASYALVSTVQLLENVARLEAKLIAGSARPDEIDAYVLVQLELAQRLIVEPHHDPRD